MLELEKWAIGRFKPMAMLAQVAAITAKDCHETILASRRPWLRATEEAAAIEPSHWTKLYRRPGQMEGEMLQFLFEPDQPEAAMGMGEEWAAARRIADACFRKSLEELIRAGISQKDVDRANRYLDLLYRLVHVPLLKRLLRGEDEPPPKFRQWFGQPGFVFFMAIAMPCWLEYHQSPWALLLKARRGEFDALEKLLRLDAEVKYDPVVRRQLYKMRNRHPQQYAELMKAEQAGRTATVSLKQVKFALGGLLMKWSKELEGVLKGDLFFELLPQFASPEKQGAVRKWMKVQRKRIERQTAGCWLKAPDIKKLFDAVASDTGMGPGDPAFARQPHSIYKRLKRNVHLWPGLRETDIRRAA